MNIVSAYTQAGSDLEVKENFWKELDEVVESIPKRESLVAETFMVVLVKGKEGKEKLMSHTMKIWEKVVEATNTLFALLIRVEKYSEGQTEFYCVFKELAKASNRVPREELLYYMRESGVVEKYVRVG